MNLVHELLMSSLPHKDGVDMVSIEPNRDRVEDGTLGAAISYKPLNRPSGLSTKW